MLNLKFHANISLRMRNLIRLKLNSLYDVIRFNRVSVNFLEIEWSVYEIDFHKSSIKRQTSNMTNCLDKLDV